MELQINVYLCIDAKNPFNAHVFDTEDKAIKYFETSASYPHPLKAKPHAWDKSQVNYYFEEKIGPKIVGCIRTIEL